MSPSFIQAQCANKHLNRNYYVEANFLVYSQEGNFQIFYLWNTFNNSTHEEEIKTKPAEPLQIQRCARQLPSPTRPPLQVEQKTRFVSSVIGAEDGLGITLRTI